MKVLLLLLLTQGPQMGSVTSEKSHQESLAVQALNAHQYQEALEILQQLLEEDPRNPRYLFLMGKLHKQQGDLQRALHFFKKARDLSPEPDPEILKQMATVLKWMRRYHEAEKILEEVLKYRPTDQEARFDLQNLRLRRSLHVMASYGGWEVDYTQNSMTGTLFWGGWDRLDLYVGYAKTDKLFYRRTNLWIDAYFFPIYRMYLRFGYRNKHYSYPPAINPNPDANAYAQIPDYQLEMSYTYRGEDYVSVEFEKFDPNFYWNSQLRAHNWKVSGTVRATVIAPFYVKGYAAWLRDPDPRTVVQDTTQKLVDFSYETLHLIGGALGADFGTWGFEGKYLPDRDLDRSTDYSIFFRAFYRIRNTRFVYDFLYDHYSQFSYRAGQTSKVHMLTLIWDPFPYLRVRLGGKVLMESQKTSLNPFVFLRLKTGL